MKKRTFLSVMALFLLLFAVFSVAALLFSSSPPPATKCKSYGLLPKSEVFSSYSVKSGDSLLSIAKNELGDSSRAGEIAALNEDVYPGLSLRNSFLEVGWKIVLPPKDTRVIASSLKVAGGEVVITSDSWGVYWPNSGVSSFNSNLPKGFKNGTCVILAYQEVSSQLAPLERNLLLIKLQE